MAESKTEKAVFAGGCFWCMVKPFKEWDGIHGLVSGYTGGTAANPTYEQVKSGKTGHFEAVEIEFDPEVFPYEKLLDVYWQQIDPTDDGGQFQDRGDSYRTAIFWTTDDQRSKALRSREALEASGRFQKPIVTEILPASVFYPAEDYHQDYYLKEPDHYEQDRAISGRDEFIQDHWKN
ncbi:peptide-methionine (S)-S-oxide reductase MsrA [Bhargavaea cecembensis]|uniref:peptide-methionine (S)-S-oxide reductase MsrA n=1 Tax=Bhargavaea cecembensis TaxID=394098 RepID=UPI00058B015D|nr:peptide-methionine (S)-S-oxide reductase MsrA [Bhargavaea cecembensis]